MTRTTPLDKQQMLIIQLSILTVTCLVPRSTMKPDQTATQLHG